MKLRAAKWRVWGVIALLSMVAAYFSWSFLTEINFADDPALILDVSETGVVTLKTHRGVIAGPLAGVDWKSDAVFLAEAQKLIDEARRDTVAWGKSPDGGIKIWYDSNDGAQYLNEKLGAILK